MAGSVHKLRNDDGGLPPLELYKVAVDEYRFQAQYNWSRTQYLLAFNAGVLSVASAVASRPGRSAAFVFVLGAVAAVLSALVVRTQHAYYRAARDRMKRAEEHCGISQDLRTDTTSTLGERQRLISVNQVVYLLLTAIAAGNIVGAAVTGFR